MKFLWSAIKGYIAATDKWLLLLWLGASGLSILYLSGLYLSGLSYFGKVSAQGAGILIGLVAAIIISLFDYRSLIKLWKIYLPICVILVVCTFFWGTIRGGDQAWLYVKLGGISFSMQPSEFLKISFITTFALHLDKVQGDINSLPNMAWLCLHGGLHILLIQIQGDSGTALIFVFIFVIMMFSAGMSWKYMAAAAVAVVAAVPVLWMKIMTDDQKMRILTVYNPDLDPAYAYQQLRSVMAMGMGGLRGTGIFSGRHVYVPEIYNDFIFAFICESSGFIGALGVVALLTAICFKLLYNSTQAKDTLGRFLCVGLFAMFLSQTVINLGMCLSLLPVIGVTLPLLSSGGTSVLSMYLGLGFVLSVYCHSSSGLFGSVK